MIVISLIKKCESVLKRLYFWLNVNVLDYVIA